MHNLHNKTVGYASESLVADYYHAKGYTIIQQNFTIRGGEADILAESDHELLLIEVKTVDAIDDYFNYITPKKLSTLIRTFDVYLFRHPTPKTIRIDVVFVKGNIILEIYENVTNT